MKVVTCMLSAFILFAGVTFANDVTYLATFDGSNATSWNWDETDNSAPVSPRSPPPHPPPPPPNSVGTFSIDEDNKKGVFNGTCAQGPCSSKIQTKQSLVKTFPDVSGVSNGYVMLKVRSDTPDFKGFRVGFLANDPNIDPYFQKSFKAPFHVSGTDWQVISVLFTDFSYDWSPFTGRCETKDPDGIQHNCCGDVTPPGNALYPISPDYCPTGASLRGIVNLQIWSEGATGDFHLEIEWIGAGLGKNRTQCGHFQYCSPIFPKVCQTPTKSYCPSGSFPTGSCPDGTFCDYLTQLCVIRGVDCIAPCPFNSFCSHDLRKCLTPFKSRIICLPGNGDCGTNSICDPLTEICVSVGEKCTPP